MEKMLNFMGWKNERKWIRCFTISFHKRPNMEHSKDHQASLLEILGFTTMVYN
jgi:hypothetical protein